MDVNFILDTDMPRVEKCAAEWAESAETGRMYSMEEITQEIYCADFDSEEFWRTCVFIGPTITRHGFKRIYYKNRRFWVKSAGMN